MQKTISICSDLQGSSPQLAIVRHLLSEVKAYNVVDLVHTHFDFNLIEVSLFIQRYFDTFERESIHLLLCNVYDNFDGFLLLSYVDGHYFICPNNGMLSLIKPYKDWEWIKQIPMPNPQYMDMAKAIVKTIEHISDNEGLLDINSNDLVVYKNHLPVLYSDHIKGSVMYIDDFGNAVTNIGQSIFKTKNKLYDSYVIHWGVRDNQINGVEDNYIDSISTHYTEKERGNIVAIFNSIDLLEISVVHGNASQLLGLQSVYYKGLNRHLFHNEVEIKFKKNPV